MLHKLLSKDKEIVGGEKVQVLLIVPGARCAVIPTQHIPVPCCCCCYIGLIKIGTITMTYAIHRRDRSWNSRRHSSIMFQLVGKLVPKFSTIGGKRREYFLQQSAVSRQFALCALLPCGPIIIHPRTINHVHIGKVRT